MNARFIQGIFDDKADRTRFSRFGLEFDPEKNTDALIAALPEWYMAGLRAFTVGFQGGGPCHTVPNGAIENNPFSPDGRSIDPAYAARMTRLLNAADELGMAVIVSVLYCGQVRHLDGADGIMGAVGSACRFLRDGGWKNVIIEPANEYDIDLFEGEPLIQSHQGMVSLLKIAKRESGGLPVGCSGGGGTLNEEVARESDVLLFHGNGQTRTQMFNLIQKARRIAPDKPIVCNEDSPALSNMQVCMDAHASWGYYNAMTKQELATDWRILPGEDEFYALRLCENLNIPRERPLDTIKLVGTGKNACWDGKCWPRLAALYPEEIDFVDFYLDGEFLYRAYDDPHSLYTLWNWLQGPLCKTEGTLRAEVNFFGGRKIARQVRLGE